ncbi:MAG: restriction endonuclease subunit S [Chitinophagales bacterium]
MQTALENIASIQTGLFAKTVAEGDIVYLQSRHFDEEGKLRFALHPDLNLDSVANRHLLRPGDILFAAKGTRNFAAVYESHNPPCVASTSFFVIRLKANTILPKYLVWFLNHPDTQKILKAQAIGTSIVSISKVVLGTLEIPIPPIEKQEAVVKIASLKILEQRIKKQLADLQEQYFQYLLIKSIKK